MDTIIKEKSITAKIKSAMEQTPTFVLKNANVINVFTEEIINCDVALYKNTIIGMGDFTCKNTYDCKGKYLAPGLIDSHVHIESSMATPKEFAKIVMPYGTTSVVADPHEIANVCGIDGIRMLKKMSEGIGLNVYYMFPSCVPCMEFEENYAKLNNEDAAALLYEGVVHGLGEVMDWGAVTSQREDMIKKLVMFDDMVIDGHAPNVRGKELQAYILGGSSTDHEAYTYEEIIEKLRLGMRILIRVGSAANNMSEVLKQLCNANIPIENLMMCTDDKHTENILESGHINHIVKMAVEAGFTPQKAIQMATINSAKAYGLKNKGAIGIGYDGDLVLFDDLVHFKPLEVFVDGINIKDIKPTHIKGVAKHNTVNIAPFTTEVFKLKAEGKMPVITMPVGQLSTVLSYEEVPIKAGVFVPKGDYAKIICMERHHATGHTGVGIVKDFGLKEGGIASTVAHDSHNIVAIGTNDEDIALCINTLKEIGGGYVFVKNGEVVATLPLQVAGLLSDLPYKELITIQQEFLARLEGAGVPKISDPLIRLSFFCLPVIPQARVTTKGIYDVLNNKFINNV